MKMKAHNLSRIDKQYEMHMQAWLNHQVTATKEQGKKQVPIFKKFTDFYDYEKELKQLEDENKSLNPQQKRLARIALLVNTGKGVKHGRKLLS